MTELDSLNFMRRRSMKEVTSDHDPAKALYAGHLRGVSQCLSSGAVFARFFFASNLFAEC